MNTITRGIAGAALAAGLALSGGVAANAADGVPNGTVVSDPSKDCQAEFSAKDRRDGYFEYQLGITCEWLAPGVEARAIATFRNADGTTRDIATDWVTSAPGSERISVATKATAKAIDVRIEHRTSAGPIDG